MLRKWDNKEEWGHLQLNTINVEVDRWAIITIHFYSLWL
jgi:hypothetical protein